MKSQILQVAASVLVLSTMSAAAATRYVNVSSASPAPPYTNWTTAATTIQDAIDAALAGDQILVTNGVYQTGGRVVFGATTNRVAVNKPVAVQSVNGAAVTVIRGFQVPGTTNGDSAIRCVYLTNGAALVGFTLTNGATRNVAEPDDLPGWQSGGGGGVWCESASAVVSNCMFNGNSAYTMGGGASGGTLNNCTFSGNSAGFGGGAGGATLNNCTFTANSANSEFGGGGVLGGTLNNCTLAGNSAFVGGGEAGGTLNNCTLIGNSALNGGGAEGGTLNNCTLSGNSALYGGGAYGSTLNNCIVYYNSAQNEDNYSGSFLSYSCTTPLPADGIGNITNAPLFVDYAGGNLRLQSNSPCINAGDNASAPAGLDLDDNPRIVGGTVDVGAYEFQSLQPHISNIRYVDVNSTSPAPPYTNWTTAAATIQDAVDAAVDGDQILVTNGVYQSGGRVVFGAMMNRVAVNKPVAVQSVNGAAVTVIRGFQVPGTTNGDSAIRCVYLTNGAALVGFTLTNGATRNVAEPDDLSLRQSGGGGVWCESASAVVSNCMFNGNSAYTVGGGAGGGTLNNCTFSGNSAGFGGGAGGATLNNCTFTANSANGEFGGGGAIGSTLNNCTLAGNSAFFGGGAAGGTLNNCTLIGNSAKEGGGAINGTLNNCTITGNSATSGRGGGVLGGTLNNCILYYNSATRTNWDNYTDSFLSYSCTTPLPTNGVANFTSAPLFVDYAGGNLRLQSNSPCINAGDNASAPAGLDLDDNPRIVGGTVDVGAYEFQSLQPHISNIRYVDVNSTSPAPPYTNWTTAATTIQEAVDAAVNGDQILVTNGIYQTGGRAVFGVMTNRMAVDKPVTVRSVNGAAVTVVQGTQVPSTVNGDGAVRCVYLANGAALVGFTLTNGATRSSGDNEDEQRGGGVWCKSASAVVSNCVLTANSAFLGGGGASGGTLFNCTFIGNSAPNAFSAGGGALQSTLFNCTLTSNSAYFGGGTAGATLNNCTLTGNSGALGGGGASGGTLFNCTLTGNLAYYGGGAGECTLNNCTLTRNLSRGGCGSGAFEGTLNNCIVYDDSTCESALNYCCTTALPSGGQGNFTNAPSFVDYARGNLRLQFNSPCINAGYNANAPKGPDLDGNPRIVGGTVDVGAYEFQAPHSLISYAWLQQYGLPTDGSADYTDTDGDGMNNWQEWRAGTDPNNALSALRLLSPASGATGMTVSWQSVTGRNYVSSAESMGKFTGLWEPS